jgi:hypothetical protein
VQLPYAVVGLVIFRSEFSLHFIVSLALVCVLTSSPLHPFRCPLLLSPARRGAARQVRFHLRYPADNVAAVERLALFLQLCCENHCTSMQDYLRAQPGLERPVNLARELCDLVIQFQEQLVASLDARGPLWRQGVRLAIGLMRTLVEAVQGPNKGNQLQISNAGVTDKTGTRARTLSCPFV